MIRVYMSQWKRQFRAKQDEILEEIFQPPVVYTNAFPSGKGISNEITIPDVITRDYFLNLFHSVLSIQKINAKK